MSKPMYCHECRKRTQIERVDPPAKIPKGIAPENALNHIFPIEFWIDVYAFLISEDNTQISRQGNNPGFREVCEIFKYPDRYVSCTLDNKIWKHTIRIKNICKTLYLEETFTIILNRLVLRLDQYNHEFTIPTCFKRIRLVDGRLNMNYDYSHIEYLGVNSHQFNSYMILPFTGLKQLRVDNNIHFDWYDQNLYFTLSNLETLDIGNFDIPSKEEFKKLKSLKSLTMEKMNWGEVSLDMTPPSLESIKIGNCCSFQCDPNLYGFSKITKLELRNLQGDPHFIGLCYLKSIQVLTLCSWNCLKIKIEHLLSMKTLKDLTMHCIMIVNELNIITEMPSLERLKIHGRDTISEEYIHWNILKHFPNLLELDLKQLGICHESGNIQFPQRIPKLELPKSLKKYKLNYCKNFNDGYFPRIKVGYGDDIIPESNFFV